MFSHVVYSLVKLHGPSFMLVRLGDEGTDLKSTIGIKCARQHHGGGAESTMGLLGSARNSHEDGTGLPLVRKIVKTR